MRSLTYYDLGSPRVRWFVTCYFIQHSFGNIFSMGIVDANIHRGNRADGYVVLYIIQYCRWYKNNQWRFSFERAKLHGLVNEDTVHYTMNDLYSYRPPKREGVDPAVDWNKQSNNNNSQHRSLNWIIRKIKTMLSS